MDKYWNIDFSKKYTTNNSIEVLWMMDSITIWSENLWVPEELKWTIKECIYWIISENWKLSTINWDRDNWECLWKETNEEENSQDLKSRLGEYNLRIEWILSNNTYDTNLILLALYIWIKEKNDNQIINSIKEIQNLSWWETLESATPWTKWKAIKHELFWKLAGWRLDEKWNIDLENFTFFPKTWWNILRIWWKNLRYTSIK